MTALAQAPAFETANEHALATILEASNTKSIIASTDIFDRAGIKLWARDQPVSRELQRKLLDRQLRRPLESCLLAEDGVTSLTLLRSVEALLARTGPLAPVLAPHAQRLVKEVSHVPLHPVAQLLLTASQASRPLAYEHAVEAMALAGALMAGQGGSAQDLRLAMLCGLVHDLGEMYIDPRHGEADADRHLDFESYQHLVVHPHIGMLLLAQLTDAPPTVARAVAEHHERLDGSGYPHRLQGDAVSPLGRLLAATEATLGVLRHDGADLARASVALRVVPGEFDLHWVGQLAQAARVQPSLAAHQSGAQVLAGLQWLDEVLAESTQAVSELRSTTEHAELQSALRLAEFLLGRLRAGWYDSGLWGLDKVRAEDVAELEAIEDELHHRLGGIQRAALLRAGDLPEAEAAALNRICCDLARQSR